jgi:hypothetical protein
MFRSALGPFRRRRETALVGVLLALMTATIVTAFVLSSQTVQGHGTFYRDSVDPSTTPTCSPSDIYACDDNAQNELQCSLPIAQRTGPWQCPAPSSGATGKSRPKH